MVRAYNIRGILDMVESTHFYSGFACGHMVDFFEGSSEFRLCFSRVNQEAPGGCEIPCTCHYYLLGYRLMYSGVVVNHEAPVGGGGEE